MEYVSYEALAELLAEARDQVPRGFYLHYKSGDTYEVIGHCVLEASQEAAVKYVDIRYREMEWVRTIGEWLLPATVDGRQVRRFARLD